MIVQCQVLKLKNRQEGTLQIENRQLILTFTAGVFTGADFGDFQSADGDGLGNEYSIEFYIPVIVRNFGKRQSYPLFVSVAVESGRATFHLSLVVLGTTFQATSLLMENALIALQVQLGISRSLEICLACRYSSYNPYGNIEFGDLWCLRGYKEEVSKLRDKVDLVDFINRCEVEFPNTEEFSHCSEFLQIGKGDFVYSDWSYHIVNLHGA